jgi:hypothetical protein
MSISSETDMEELGPQQTAFLPTRYILFVFIVLFITNSTFHTYYMTF